MFGVTLLEFHTLCDFTPVRTEMVLHCVQQRRNILEHDPLDFTTSLNQGRFLTVPSPVSMKPWFNATFKSG